MSKYNFFLPLILTIFLVIILVKFPGKKTSINRVNTVDSIDSFTVSGGTFDANMYVIISKDTALVYRYIKNNINLEIDSSYFDSRGFCTEINGGGCVIWLPEFNINSAEDVSVANHELSHAAIGILKWGNVLLSDSTEEVYTYEMQYLSKGFYSKFIK